MSFNDQDIKNLFQDKLANHESAVSPELWSGIQSGLGTGMAASSAASAGISGLKLALLAAAVAGVTVLTVVLLPEEKAVESPAKVVEQITEEVEAPAIITESEDSVEEPIIEEREIPLTEKNDQAAPAEPSPAVIPAADPTKKTTQAVTEQKAEAEQTESQVASTPSESSVNESPQLPIAKSAAAEPKLIVKGDENSPMDIIFSAEGEAIDLTWNFGDGTSSNQKTGTHKYSEQGDYSVTATWVDVTGNSVEKSSEVQAYESPVLVLPNVFTPGTSPGLNDYYDIDSSASKNVEGYDIKIYNRDGEVIFNSSESIKIWDGKDKFGNPMPEGNYMAVVEAWNTVGKRTIKRQTIYLKRD